MQKEPEEAARDPTGPEGLTPDQQTEFARMIDTMTEAVTENPQSFLSLLNMLADNPDYGVNNSLLVLSQNPAATIIHSREEWETLDRSLREDAQGIQIRVQGIIGLGAERRRGWVLGAVYDASQTCGRKLVPRPALAPDSPEMERAFQALYKESPFRAIIHPDETRDAHYNEYRFRITLAPNQPPHKAFAALAREIHHAMEANTGAFRMYSRKDYELDAECFSYMLCRNMGVPCDRPDLSGISSQYSGVALEDRRENLKEMRENLLIMRNRLLKELPPQEKVQTGQEKQTGGKRKKETVR